MFKAINGWTKKKILKVLQDRKFARAAYNEAQKVCEYRTKDGNRCAVGLFIPNGHEGLSHSGAVGGLLDAFPDLRKKLPLGEKGLDFLQDVHDTIENRTNAKRAMIEWVTKNVK